MKIEICGDCGKTRINDVCEWCRYQDACRQTDRRLRRFHALLWAVVIGSLIGPFVVAWIWPAAR